MNDKELKPCPFCGGKAVFYKGQMKIKGEAMNGLIVKCTKCEGRTRREILDPSVLSSNKKYEEVAKLWNRRTNDSI